MLQNVVVALIVLIALAFTVWKLMPARRRLQVLLALDAWSARHPALAGWREHSLKARIARAAGSGCGGCAARDVRPPPRPR
jgi:hypothetical protein